MSPDGRSATPPAKFRAVLPPELQGIDLDDESSAAPMDVEDHIASLDARMEALDGREGE
jgi:hypothetical protein